MADVILSKQKIEPGKTERLKEWAQEVRNREAEAIKTLQNEGMNAETAFIEHTDEGDFLIYYMNADDIQQVYDAYEESSHAIDEEHEQVMLDVLENGENVGDYDLLYHLRSDRSEGQLRRPLLRLLEPVEHHVAVVVPLEVVVSPVQYLAVLLQVPHPLLPGVLVGQVAEGALADLDDLERLAVDLEAVALVGVLSPAVDLGDVAVSGALAHPLIREQRVGVDCRHGRRFGPNRENGSVGGNVHPA